MVEFSLKRVALPTGVELDIVDEGPAGAPAIFFLHGFPESHRTWRHQIAALSGEFRCIAPDQRGFARSSKPEGVENYTPDKPVADLIALADALGIDRFILVGHDWGGAVAWMAALSRPDRIEKLVIVNAPHPYIFQKTLLDDPAQRSASQYITAFRNPGFETYIDSIGIEGFFDRHFAKHVDGAKLGDEQSIYIDQWSQPGAMTGMLNWYRASSIIVPAPDEAAEHPAFLDQPFPKLQMPVLVIWGMRDTALLPCQLDGLDALVPDLRVVTTDAGHFVTWEDPNVVTNGIRDFATS